MHGDGMGTRITVQKSAGNGVGMGNKVVGMGRGRDIWGQKGTGTTLAGWDGDGDDFHLRADL